MTGATGPGEPLPSWWGPLLSQVRAARTEDFTRLRTPTGIGRDSAVLVLLAEQQRDRGRPADQAMDADSDIASTPDVLVLQRAATMRNHAGQPAFPGGAADPGDADPAATALREAHEEVGLDPTSVTVLAELPRLWIPVSGFVVTPVLAWWHAPHEVHPRDPGEVARVARLPIAELVDPANRLRVRHPTSGWIGPAFEVRGMLVWGFTAGVLAALLQMGGWARPWPQDRIIELPSTSTSTVPPAYSVASGSADPLPSPADTQSRPSAQPAGDRDLGPARRGEAALRTHLLP
jgi:8-oxo-dGTP pyrophosphatase MutT (NUDIX family)